MKIVDGDDIELKSDSNSMEIARIFSAKLTEDLKIVVLTEECDRYFEVEANAEELGCIISALARLRDRMVP